MKTQNNALIFLPVFVDSCSSSTAGQLNTGSVSECLEGVTTKLVLAKSAFRFTDIADFKTMASWTTAITNKDIVPLFGVYEVASADTEAIKFETGNFSAVTKKEIKKMTSESYLSLCSHRALKSYENSGYTQVFEITENGEVLGVYDPDGVRVKGQDITEFEVAIRQRATNDKVPYSMVTITFRDFDEFENNGIIAKPTWDANAVNGIFGITLEVQGTPSSTEIIVKATSGCGQTPYEDIVLADWTFGGGTIDSSAYSATTGFYTLGGTGLTSGDLNLDGVIAHGDVLVEGTAVTVTI